MNQAERLDYLIHKLKKESFEYSNLEIPVSKEDKQVILRSLMNIRMPRPLEEEVAKVQDDYLKERASEKGIVHLRDIPTIQEELNSTHPFAEKLSIWQGDITRLAAGAIVNAANSRMLGCFVPMHKCIDNCIHSFAGIQLRCACNDYMEQKRIEFGEDYEEPTGRAVLTSAFNLPADYVIHTVGPIVTYRLTEELRMDLVHCYESILQCCVDNNIRSVAFCCISTGEFHFPNEEAANIAVNTVTEFMHNHEKSFERVIFNVFKDNDKDIYRKILRK